MTPLWLLTAFPLVRSDSGTRHHSRFWNDEYLAKEGIPVSHDIDFILNAGDEQPDYSS